MTPTDNTTHRYTTEVSGNELGKLKRDLEQINLTGNEHRIKFEIESPDPIFPDPVDDADQETKNENETENETETAATAGPETTDAPGDAPPQQARADGGTAAKQPTTRIINKTESGPAAAEYLEETEDDGDGVDPREKVEKQVNPGTARWCVLGLFYRMDGKLKTSQACEMLGRIDHTDWNHKDSTFKTTVPILAEEGLLEKDGWGEYSITQLGRDYMQTRINAEKGYPLHPLTNAFNDDRIEYSEAIDFGEGE